MKRLLNNISFNADITYYNENYKAFCSIDQNGSFSVEIKDPSELEGMLFTINKDDVRVNYKGLTYTPNSNSLLSSACGMLYDAFTSTNSDNAQYEYGEQNFSVSAKTSNGEFLLQFSPTGLPLDLKYTSGVFCAEFSNVTIVKNE